jgi:molybdopterin-guanine dinucleotide biosynthesis protein
MKQSNLRLDIIRKLYSLIHSREGLWKEVAKLDRTLDYLLIEDFSEKILRQLEVIERHIGDEKTEEIKEIKALIASLTPPLSPQAANLPVA